MSTQDLEASMRKSLEATQRNFNTIRTGRANSSLLDRISVEYYGAETPLKSLATLSTPDSQTIQIQPFDISALASIADRTSLTGIVLPVLPCSFCPSHPVACAEGRCVPGTRLLLMSTAFSLRRLSWPCRAEGSIRMLPGQVASGALDCREKKELTTTSVLACRAL